MNFSCECTGLGHRFQQKFLFRNLNLEFQPGKIHLIQGKNGTGKSTFLKILSGALEPTEGNVRFSQLNEEKSIEDLWHFMGFVAPYQELPDELYLPELIDFQRALDGSSLADNYAFLVKWFGLDRDLHKQIRNFSTGMKQKARFVLGLGSDRPIWILDEPGSNLDPESAEKLWQYLSDHKSERLVIVASNEPEEFKQADILIELR